MKICVTGSTGFLGSSLCEELSKYKHNILGICRKLNFSNIKKKDNLKFVLVKDICNEKNWDTILSDVECVIHCAAKAHVMKESKNDILNIYHSINVNATKILAESAAKVGVKRFIFISSVKVNGERTESHSRVSFSKNKKKIFKHSDAPNPKDSYAVTKFQAEKVLWDISVKTGLEVTVIRPPLVYGYGVKGNLSRLIKLIKSGIPLPLGMIENERSMIGLDNLISLLIRCVDHPDAAGKIFLASDSEDLSTPKLINLIANSMGLKAHLFPFPIFLIKFIGSVCGKKKEIDRLVGSLKIDNDYVKKVLNWQPSVSVEDGIKKMIEGK